MVRTVCALGCLAFWLASAPARAQEASPKAKPALSPNDEVARGLFQAGKAAYEAGSYEEAIDLFEKAYARSGRPGLLFNIGQVADRLRQDEKALRSFRAYLEQVPNAENRAEVESRIAALERAEAQRQAATASAAPAPAPVAPTPEQTAQQAPPASAIDTAYVESEESPSPPVTEQWWFWTSIGVVVAGGTAVALAVALGGDEGGTQAPFQGSAGSFKGP